MLITRKPSTYLWYVDWIRLKIKSVREAKKLSQEELADIIGVSQRTYSNWENGRTELTVQNLERIAKGLEVPTTYFWDEKNYQQKSSETPVVNEPDNILYEDLLKTKNDLIAQQREHIQLLKEKLSKYEKE